jgi:hypothetical protein
MYGHKGFIISDFLFFKSVLQKDVPLNFILGLKPKKNLICRKLFYYRKCRILNMIETLQKKTKHNFNYNFRNNENKIYEKAGWSIIFNHNLVFFKFIKNKINYSFFLKKLKMILNKKLKTKKNAILNYIIERFEYLKGYHQNKLKIYILKNMEDGMCFVVGKKVKSIGINLKKFSKKLLKNFSESSINIKNNSYLFFKWVKYRSVDFEIVFFYDINKSRKFLIVQNHFEDLPIIYFKKTFLETGIWNFAKFLLIKFHFKFNNVKLTFPYIIIQNTIQINCISIFFGFLNNFNLDIRLKLFPKNIKGQYVLLILRILVSINF